MSRRLRSGQDIEVSVLAFRVYVFWTVTNLSAPEFLNLQDRSDDLPAGESERTRVGTVCTRWECLQAQVLADKSLGARLSPVPTVVTVLCTDICYCFCCFDKNRDNSIYHKMPLS